MSFVVQKIYVCTNQSNYIFLKSKHQIIFGRHPVVDAIKEGEPVDKVLLLQGTRGELEKELRLLCREKLIPITMTPKAKLDRLTFNKNHQGVIAFISPVRFYQVEDVVPHIFEKGETPLLLMLDGVTDTRNFGAITRSAEAFGVHAIIVPLKGSAQIGPDAIKTSAGALLKVPICKVKSLNNTIEYLQSSGIQVFASSLEAKDSIDKIDFKSPAVIVLGSEDLGVTTGVLRNANQTFIIPQIGTTDSLNVSVSAGVMLYEVQRQRGE